MSKRTFSKAGSTLVKNLGRKTPSMYAALASSVGWKAMAQMRK